MKIQESAENYLETILMLQKRKGAVRSIDVANELGFSKPSVSVAMKNLRENGYIDVDPDGFLILLSAGRQIAEKIYERHTLLSNWLTALGVDPDTAVHDACRIEHVISSESSKPSKGTQSKRNKIEKRMQSRPEGRLAFCFGFAGVKSGQPGRGSGCILAVKPLETRQTTAKPRGGIGAVCQKGEDFEESSPFSLGRDRSTHFHLWAPAWQTALGRFPVIRY